MLVAAAVCPHPPLLIPAAMGTAGLPHTEPRPPARPDGSAHGDRPDGSAHGDRPATPAVPPDARARLGQPDASARGGRPAESPDAAEPGARVTAANPQARVDAEIRRLRAACYAAVLELAAAQPGLIIVAGGGSETRTHPGSAAGSLNGLGIPFTTGSGRPVLPLSLTVGSWLIRYCLGFDADHRPGELGGPAMAGAGSGHSVLSGGSAVELHEVAQSWSAARCVALGERLAAAAPRVALLAMGDGTARRALGVPGAADPPADRYDARIAGALAAGSADFLAMLDPSQDAEFQVAGRAAWQVLAGAATGRRISGQLSYAAAPLDVGYFVATWRPI